MTAALGVAAAIDNSKLLYEILRWTGVAYILSLACKTWSNKSETSSDVTTDHSAHACLAFQRGLITNLLNPKAAIFFVAVVPTFVRPDGSVVTQTLLLFAIFLAVATAVHTAIVLLVSRVQHFASQPARRRPALALVLVGIAGWLAFSTAR